jgi:hypothetical protein
VKKNQNFDKNTGPNPNPEPKFLEKFCFFLTSYIINISQISESDISEILKSAKYINISEILSENII